MDTSVLISSIKRVGEKHHRASLQLAGLMGTGDHHAIASALVAVELPGVLASSTSMPVDSIYQAFVSIRHGFALRLLPFEPYVNRSFELMMELRDQKRRWKIGSADFHHLATAVQEDAKAFVTTDEKHLLRPAMRRSMEPYLKIMDPSEAVGTLAQ